VHVLALELITGWDVRGSSPGEYKNFFLPSIPVRTIPVVLPVSCIMSADVLSCG